MAAKKPVRRKPRRKGPAPPSVGLTGGIASGKSEVASVFRRLGARVISADREARALLAGDPVVVRSITRLLGPRAYTSAGKPDRKFIARSIFSSAVRRRKVNAVIHPAVIAGIRRIVAAEKRSRTVPLIAVEAALIYEAGMGEMFDAVVVVDAPLRVRLERIRKRDGLTASEARRRMRSQLSNARKAAAADIVITNAGDLASLRAAGRFVFRLLSRTGPFSR